MQVVKLLLQYSSNVTDRSLGGVVAAEMEKEHLQGSAFTQQHHCEAQYSTAAVFQSLHTFSEDIMGVF